MKQLAFKLSLILSLVSLSACSVLQPRERQSTAFLPKPELLKEDRDRAPFQGYWVSDPVTVDNFKSANQKIYLAPINIDNVVGMLLAADDDESTKKDRIEEVQQLANYFRERVRLNISQDKSAKFLVVESPEGAFSVNLALVDVIPSNPGINLVGTAAGFFVPGGGLIKLAGESSVAMEGYSCNMSSQIALFEQFKDRETQKASAFTLKDFQRYAHIRVILDDWANQVAQLTVTKSSVLVEEELPFLISPL